MDRLLSDEGISRKELKAIQQRFLQLNQKRQLRILGELRPLQQDFIQLLPLLFHINHPMLPGFITTDTPAGIPNYSPHRDTLLAARKLSRSFAYKPRAMLRFWIQGIYLMGSTGTIAHTRGSDFDLWVCYDPKLSEEGRIALQEKANLIEQAGDKLGLEVHFFLMDVERFRRKEMMRLSKESSGSTQHDLLLEEFYRSSVLLAGRYPLWWLVPPSQEHNYREYASMLLTKRFVDERECLDFGGLDELSADEFFGVALWQLFKGIDSPYKAVLKILLMESYTQTYPTPHWLAQQTKELIYAGEPELSELDSYILMYRQVERYLVARSELDRLGLVRRCLYFKFGKRLSQIKKPTYWRDSDMLALTKEWGWGDKELRALDGRAEWKIDKVLKERNALVQELSHSYRLLTNFARTQAGSNKIDPHELNLIGRKLYTALERRPGKIDSINPGISSNLHEPHISIHFTTQKSGDQVWMLYRGKVDLQQRSDHSSIKVANNLLELLAWCHVNQICSDKTVVSLYPEDLYITPLILRPIMAALHQIYPNQELPQVPLEALAQPPKLLSTALFVNIGIDPMQQLSQSGKQRTSLRIDALSYGALHHNLIISMEQVTHTSWEELLVSRWDGADGLADALVNYLNLMLGQQNGDRPDVSAFSFTGNQSNLVANRITELFKSVSDFFLFDGVAQGRYIYRVSDEFYLLQLRSDGKEFEWIGFHSEVELFEALEQPCGQYRLTQLEPCSLDDSPYPTLYSYNKPDRIQLFYSSQKGCQQLFILDEHGALFRQSFDADTLRFSLIQMCRFLTSLQRFRALMSDVDSVEILKRYPEIYRLSHQQDSWQIEQQSQPWPDQAEDYTKLRLITDPPSHHSSCFTLTCGDQEFSSLLLGDELYQNVAQYIEQLRRDRTHYPIYLTSVEFTQYNEVATLSTVEILTMKRRIEQRLTQAMAGS